MTLLGQAVRIFRRDLLKALLAASCITVGTVVFVLILGFVQSLDVSIGQMLRGLGRDTLVVTRDGTELKTREERRARRVRQTAAAEDQTYLARRLEGAAGLSRRLVRVGPVRAAGREINRVFLVQAEAPFGGILDLEVVEGRFFSSFEVEEGRPVAVVGPAVAAGLYPGGSALGEPIEIYGKFFRIVGVFDARGALFGQDLDKWVVLPLTAGPPPPRGETEEIVVGLAPGSDLVAAQQEVTGMLRAHHGLAAGRPADFEVLNQGSILELFSRLLRGSLAFSILIGTIVLAASGLAVMNTQLVSVDERIGEIGVYKAVGATNYQILWLFLWESLLIVLAGGVVGTLVAQGLGELAARTAAVRLDVGWQLLVLDWVVIALVGLFFGFYPALKGGRMTAVECIRRGRGI
jgi:putative ABC transport system permease protein